LKAGDEVTLTGGDLAFGGDCVCRTGGRFVVFVPYLSPGDAARVRIGHVRPNFARGEAVELVSPGPERAVPPCRWFGECGGCQWMHVTTDSQRSAKERIVRTMLAQLGLGGKVEPIRGADPLGYRNRLVLPVRAGAAGLEAGFFRSRSHSIVEVDSCAVQRPLLWEVSREALRLMRASGLPGWDEETGRGFFRHLVVRCAAGTGEAGVIIVTSDGEFPGGGEMAEELMKSVPAVKGVSRNINPDRTNVILGRKTLPLAGAGHLREEIGGMVLRASLTAFFQANHAVTGEMLKILREWTAGGSGGILDLYCGVGLLGLAAAGETATWLAGIEEEESAVADARANAEARGVGRAFFRAGTVESVLPNLLRETGTPGTVILDPPRKGLTPAALAAVLAVKAPLVIYVSCDPATFSRDLRGLAASGYRLETAVPLDMFPQTYHIELMAKLRR